MWEEREVRKHLFSVLLVQLCPSRICIFSIHLSSVQFSHSVLSNSLWLRGLQHAKPPCPSPTPRVYSNSCPLNWWCHPTDAILCRPLLLPPSIFPSIRIFSNESALCIRWAKYWSFSFTISPSHKHSGLIFRMDWLDLFAVQGTPKSLLQHHSSKASILQHSAFFIVQLSHPYMTTGKIIALTRWTFVGKVMSLFFNMLSRLVITFLPRSKRLLISWLQSPSAAILEPPQNKVCHGFSIYLPWSDGTRCHDLCFWMLSFFTFFSTFSPQVTNSLVGLGIIDLHCVQATFSLNLATENKILIHILQVRKLRLRRVVMCPVSSFKQSRWDHNLHFWLHFHLWENHYQVRRTLQRLNHHIIFSNLFPLISALPNIAHVFSNAHLLLHMAFYGP